jgi:hypothetical protein
LRLDQVGSVTAAEYVQKLAIARVGAVGFIRACSLKQAVVTEAAVQDVALSPTPQLIIIYAAVGRPGGELGLDR